MLNWLFGKKPERIIVKISGNGDLNFLNDAITNMLPASEVRTTGFFKKKFVRDDQGRAEVLVLCDDYMRYARVILKTLDFTIVEENYGSVPRNARPPHPATITYTVTRAGRTVVFDLSTT